MDVQLSHSDPERDFDLLPEMAAQEFPTDEWSLCLSGGGFRAMLFHTGALWRLHEARVLSRISFSQACQVERLRMAGSR